ncbi:MAG: hypothetical protein ACR2HN_02375 [Tepidiformaceae bacterium]
MREQNPTCEHRWRYFVHVDSRAVRARECERCGHRAAITPSVATPEPELAVA